MAIWFQGCCDICRRVAELRCREMAKGRAAWFGGPWHHKFVCAVCETKAAIEDRYNIALRQGRLAFWDELELIYLNSDMGFTVDGTSPETK